MHAGDPFLFQLFFIFVWAKLFGAIFERLQLPSLLWQILAGVLVEPSVTILVHDSAHEAVFVAAAMVATSVGITARVLGDMHVLQTLPARIILGAAVFDDILGMILLSVVVGLVSTTGLPWAQLTIASIEAIGFALLMMFYAPRVVRRMEPGW